MEQTTAVPAFSLAHVGINADSAEASAAIAEQLAAVFSFPVKPGNSSNFAGVGVEVMKGAGLGKNGHIGFGTPDVEAAVRYLSDRGVAFDPATARYKDGVLNAIYLKEEFGGFAVHLVRKG